MHDMASVRTYPGGVVVAQATFTARQVRREYRLPVLGPTRLRQTVSAACRRTYARRLIS
jgi:hypothetical protein